jgi:hypothetical protein
MTSCSSSQKVIGIQDAMMVFYMGLGTFWDWSDSLFILAWHSWQKAADFFLGISSSSSSYGSGLNSSISIILPHIKQRIFTILSLLVDQLGHSTLCFIRHKSPISCLPGTGSFRMKNKALDPLPFLPANGASRDLGEASACGSYRFRLPGKGYICR